MLRIIAVLAASAGVALIAGGSPTPAAPFHPHFNKKVQVQLNNGPTLTVSHITVPLNKEKEDAVKAGESWHLGNAHIEVDKKVKIGGLDVEPGKYSIKARKTEDGKWELVLDVEGRFNAKITDAGRDMVTLYETGLRDREHLSLDIQPSGDKSATKLYLDVRWGDALARSEIVVPKE